MEKVDKKQKKCYYLIVQLIFLLPGQDGNVAAILTNINVHFFYGEKCMKKESLDILLKLARKAYRKNEVPVSAVIMCDNKVISKAYNKKNLLNNPMMHAEIICLNKAYKKLKRWNLNDCVLYVTLEPCDMCKLVIEESRIDQVYYILERGELNNKYSKTQYEQVYDCKENEFLYLMKDFFKKIRKK